MAATCRGEFDALPVIVCRSDQPLKNPSVRGGEVTPTLLLNRHETNLAKCSNVHGENYVKIIFLSPTSFVKLDCAELVAIEITIEIGNLTIHLIHTM